MVHYRVGDQDDVDDVNDDELLLGLNTRVSTSVSNPYGSFITRFFARVRQVGTAPSPPYLPVTESRTDLERTALRSSNTEQWDTNTGIKLALTPETQYRRDPFDEHLDSLDRRTRIREHRRKRNQCIIWSSVVTSLLVLIYALDVERSWTAVERQWASMAEGDSQTDSHRVSSNSTYGQTTKIWGHSHNDEMHGKSAFTSALGLGFGSIEVDTYLQSHHDGSKSLPVGHIPVDLKADRTLQSIYLDPILRILDERNMDRETNESWIGLLVDDPSAEVQLVIDFKSDGIEMWPFVLQALLPLRDRGYLTTYSQKTGNFTRGPLTIIGTGNTPLSHVYYSPERVIFYDAPLRSLHKSAQIPATPAGPAIMVELDNTISPMASAKFPALAHIGLAIYPLPNPAIGWMRRKTDEARRRGIQSRWWGAAGNPKWVRRRVWGMMKEAQTDWINGDNLHDLARWLRQVDGR